MEISRLEVFAMAQMRDSERGCSVETRGWIWYVFWNTTVGIANVLDGVFRRREESQIIPKFLNWASRGLVVIGAKIRKIRREMDRGEVEWIRSFALNKLSLECQGEFKKKYKVENWLCVCSSR